MKKSSLFLVLTCALALMSCNESAIHDGLCGNNVFDAHEACEFVDGSVYFADNVIACPEGSRLVDVEKFECNACEAVAVEGACVKEN